MAKLKKLNTKLIKPCDFDGKRSYEAAIYAVNICNHMIDRYNAGDIIFTYENLIDPAFELSFNKDGRFEGLYVSDFENCMVHIVGDEVHVEGANDGKIFCTKKNIREFFKLWRVAKITNVTKVIDLTK